MQIAHLGPPGLETSVRLARANVPACGALGSALLVDFDGFNHGTRGVITLQPLMLVNNRIIINNKDLIDGN